MRYLFKTIFPVVILITLSLVSLSQNNTVDQIVAVVGNKIILKSDIENRFLGFQAQGYVSGSGDFKSEIFEDLLIQKLLLTQAKIDSIEITEQEVESELERKIEMYIEKIGSKEKLEQYFGKSLLEMKNEFRDDTRDERIKDKMQAEITKNIRVTPTEVRNFYNTIPKDSLPEIPGEVEIQQIVKHPEIKQEEKDRIRERLRGFRDRIISGESFATLAVLYSEDQGSAQRGGELGYTTRSELVPEFANEAFNLKTDKISKIIESEYGFHIIQLIDRKGERINVRHILLKPRISEDEKQKAIAQLDSIANLIRTRKVTFNEAAYYFSDDKDTRNNGGLLVHPYTGSSRFQKDNLPPAIAQQVVELKINEVSNSFLDQTTGKESYKIVMLKSETMSHQANLNDDWTQFENMLKSKKQQEALEKWIYDKQKSTYIHIDDSYKNSNFRYKGWIK